MMDIKHFKKIFDQELKKYISEKLKKNPVIKKRTSLKNILDYIKDFTFSGWKRIRPYLVFLTYKAFGGKQDNEILKISMGYELLHTMALIHDDIMDKGEKRHGVLTYHKHIASLLKGPEAEHHGISQAILVWDLLFARAYECIFKKHEKIKNNNLAELAQNNFQTMVNEVILGQIIDVDIMCGKEIDNEKLEIKNHYKTGWYTFVRTMLSWALLAWVDQKTLKKIKEIWTELGLAYQIRDDLLDISASQSDKTLFSDVQDGQQTYFTNFIMANWTKMEKNLLESKMKKKLSRKEIEELKKLFENSWAIKHGKELIEKHLKNAEEKIKKIKIKEKKYINLFWKIISLLRS